jgi:hypothetical protein
MLMEEWTAALGFDATSANREQHCCLHRTVYTRPRTHQQRELTQAWALLTRRSNEASESVPIPSSYRLLEGGDINTHLNSFVSLSLTNTKTYISTTLTTCSLHHNKYVSNLKYEAIL